MKAGREGERKSYYNERSVRDKMRRTKSAVTDFEGRERGSWSRECIWPPEAKKGKETDSPPEWNAATAIP